MQSFLAEPDRFARLVAIDSTGAAAGLAEAPSRRDDITGADVSPVGYIERLCVEPTARGWGVARSVVSAVHYAERRLTDRSRGRATGRRSSTCRDEERRPA